LPIFQPLSTHSTLTSRFIDSFETLNHATAFTFLSDHSETISISYEVLLQKAKAVATTLLESDPMIYGKPVLLLYPQGIDFIIGFLACLFSGAVAVPAYPPKNRKQIDRLMLIATNAGASIAFTDSPTMQVCSDKFSQFFNTFRFIATDTVPIQNALFWKFPDISSNSTAFLQYTSGSTSAPKGVMVTHANLVANLHYIQQAFCLDHNSTSASWLPQFHDMGLIDGILEPMFTGYTAHLMSPSHFVKNPLKWLELISKYHVTHSGGPNFGYDHCVDAINRLDTSIALDLSSWTSAYNGAEPIHLATMDAFSKSFSQYGFSQSAHYPCYGLAEATLMVSGKPFLESPISTNLDLGEGHSAKNVVSSGIIYDHMSVKIVATDTLKVCSFNCIGEIWVSGPSVAKGYLNDPQKTQDIFNAYTVDAQGPFMRTGDLGFFDEQGHLFVTGRMKEILIVNGKNYFPHDIERLCEETVSAFCRHGVVAFSYTTDGAEQVGIVAELKRSHLGLSDFSPVVNAVRAALNSEFGLSLSKLVLIRPASIAKTSSGKLKRSFIKTQCINNDIDAVFTWTSATAYQSLFTVLDIFNSVFNCHINSLDSKISWDEFSSMQLVEFMTSVDSQFGVSISYDDMIRLHTIAEIEALISSQQDIKVTQADPKVLSQVFRELGFYPLTSITSREGKYGQ
jgi:acyl-CoA synthetase (AMP-forming)/AMP-acid ligase II